MRDIMMFFSISNIYIDHIIMWIIVCTALFCHYVILKIYHISEVVGTLNNIQRTHTSIQCQLTCISS